MNCCSDYSTVYNNTFNAKVAARDMARYRKKGASKSTKKLLKTIFGDQDGNKNLKSLIDIGGGICAIGMESSAKGVEMITSIDASREYRAEAEMEVKSRGLEKKFKFITGDAAELSGDIPAADIVTLDKSICCYSDYHSLITATISKASNIYGIVIPRDVWWVRFPNALGNLYRKFTGDRFRSFVHPIGEIQKIIRAFGFKEISEQSSREWKILLQFSLLE